MSYSSDWFGTQMVICLVTYVWFALCLMIIANKTSTPNGWLAWIPIANLYLACKIAGKSGWWTILLLIPLINIIFAIIVWIGICQARNKPGWWVILLLIPIVNVVILGVLAFTD